MTALGIFSLHIIALASKLLCVVFSALLQCLHIYQRKCQVFQSVLSNNGTKQLLVGVKILF